MELLQELLIHSSQAGRIQNLLGFLADAVKNLKDKILYYIQSSPDIVNLVAHFSVSIGTAKFNVRKSTTLSVREAAGETISTFGVGLVDSGHYLIDVQNGIKAFLERNFFLSVVIFFLLRQYLFMK